jgi:hypothetical protein
MAMRKTVCLAAVAAAVGLATVCTAQAGDQAELRALIDKAIKATGGEEKLAKYKGETFKAKGKFYGMGEGIEYTGEWSIQLPKQMRVQIDLDVNGMKIGVVRVSNGKKLWMQIMGETKEVTDKAELLEDREARHEYWVATLLPLKGKGYQLAALGEVQVAGKPAVGVKVSHKGYRDVSLYFDKAKGLLVKIDSVVKDVMGGGDQELSQETLYSNYKTVSGVQRPWRVVINRDGKRFIDAEVTEMELRETIDDSVFGEP